MDADQSGSGGLNLRNTLIGGTNLLLRALHSGGFRKSQGIYSVRELRLSRERVESIRNAYEATLLDLLRPVNERDIYFNAMGRIDENASPLMAYDQDKEEHVFAVRYHATAGYAMPHGLFGGKDWGTLCALVSGLGGGDMEKGRTKVIEILQNETYKEAIQAGRDVHRLMWTNGWANREKVAQGLKLTSSDIEKFEQEIKALHDKKQPDYSIVDTMTDDVVEKSVSFLERLGFGGGDLKKTVRDLRRRQTAEVAWRDLTDIVGDDFPDEVIPAKLSTVANEVHEQLRDACMDNGRPDIAAWIDQPFVAQARHVSAGKATWSSSILGNPIKSVNRIQPHMNNL